MDPFLTKAVNDSGINVFQKVNEGSSEGGNVLLSPVALNFALAATCAGAEGNTRDQMRELLRHRLFGSEYNDRELHGKYRPFAAAIRDLSPQAGLHLATATWFDRGVLRSQGDNLEAYGKQMFDVFGTELLARAGTQDINEWAAKSTDCHINRLVSEDEEPVPAPMLLTTVTAVKANWTIPFDPFHTWPGEFVNDDGEGMVVQMMHQKGSFECAYLQDMRAIRIPCGPNCETAITFILPNFGKIDDAVKAFTPERWQTICMEMKKEDVRLFLPRFKVRQSTSSLKTDLMDAGVVDIFSEAHSDMARLGETGVFWAEDVICKSALIVDESGARPVQGVEDGKFEFSSVGKALELRFDRPFLFAFSRGDAIALVGKVVAPLALDG